MKTCFVLIVWLLLIYWNRLSMNVTIATVCQSFQLPFNWFLFGFPCFKISFCVKKTVKDLFFFVVFRHATDQWVFWFKENGEILFRTRDLFEILHGSRQCNKTALRLKFFFDFDHSFQKPSKYVKYLNNWFLWWIKKFTDSPS